MINLSGKHIGILLLAIMAGMFCLAKSFAQDIDNRKPDRIWKVSIEGNERFEDFVIKHYIANEQPSVWKKLTFFKRKGYLVSETEIRADVIRIERFYGRRGFNDVQVSYLLKSGNRSWRKHLVFYVKENTPIRINSVEVQLSATPQDSIFIIRNGDFNKELSRSPYRKGRIYEPVEELEVRTRIVQTLRELGYPYSNTRVQAYVDTTKRKADIVIATQSGTRARFDSIFVEGESTLDKKFIIRETEIRKGEYFTESAMRQAQQEVFKHHLFRLALVSIPKQKQDSSLNVLLRVKELPLRSVQLRGGVGDFDRLNETLSVHNFYKLFRTQATWVYRNVRGKGEQFSTSAKLSTYDRRLSAEYLFPYVYNTKKQCYH